MGKRSDFEKKPNDYYPTPLSAVIPLKPFLAEKFTFIEPCAGDYRLVDHIKKICPESECKAAYDIDPQDKRVIQRSALSLTEADCKGVDCFITNPPWSRDKKSGYILHRLIEHLSNLRPTFLLFDSDWMQTAQASPYMDRLAYMVAVGRVKWIEDSKHTGKDNCQWHCFIKDARKEELTRSGPVFFGRGVDPEKLGWT